jgi:hypothetical protein
MRQFSPGFIIGANRQSGLIGDSISNALSVLGMTNSLAFFLEASRSASYNTFGGNMQYWKDTTANSFAFFRGENALSEAADPVFAGTVGGGTASEFFFVHHNQIFRSVSSSGVFQPWAGHSADFSIAGILNVASHGSFSATLPILSNHVENDHGFSFYIHRSAGAGPEITIYITKSDGSVAMTKTIPSTPSEVSQVGSAWRPNGFNFFAVGFRHGQSGSYIRVNSMSFDFQSSLVAEATPGGNPYTEIGRGKTVGLSHITTSRSGHIMAMMLAWHHRWSATQMHSLYLAASSMTRYTNIRNV